MGMASCAEIGDNHGLFEPVHGSAPDIAGKKFSISNYIKRSFNVRLSFRKK